MVYILDPEKQPAQPELAVEEPTDPGTFKIAVQTRIEPETQCHITRVDAGVNPPMLMLDLYPSRLAFVFHDQYTSPSAGLRYPQAADPTPGRR